MILNYKFIHQEQNFGFNTDLAIIHMLQICLLNLLGNIYLWKL